MFARVARAVADAELRFGAARDAARWEGEFLASLSALDFLPNSPTLMNAGTPLGQLSACFVLPVEDSMESIFDAVKVMALVQRTGGGTGFSFSRLRPKGALVSSTGGTASGPVSFMRIFDCATENIKLGGRRRGANMGVLRVDHPDIGEFVHAKDAAASLATFNLSVGVTDAFMRAVHDGKVPERTLFDAIVDAAWRTGDPGLLFLDAINRANPTPALGALEATNPCGEVPLLPYESCNLGSINLAHMVRGSDFDWPRFRATIALAVRFLDDVIEVGRYPHAEIRKATLRTRKIGLGVMGFAELLVCLGIPYGSADSVQLAECIAKYLNRIAHRTSAGLAAERGAYPAWSAGPPLRNATLTAIAPTGTISIIADTTASIEPMFALAYRRAHVLGGQTLIEVPRVVRRVLDRAGIRMNGTPDSLPEALRRILVTALETPAEEHLRIQAAFQRFTDNSVSKTVNLPATATSADVATIYCRAWELGLKGLTIYRYGSKAEQVLELGAGEEPAHVEHGTRCDPTECRL